VWVVSATADDQALAALATLILNQQGRAAQLWLQPAAPAAGSVLIVADRQPPAAILAQDRPGIERLSSLGGANTKGLVAMLGQPVPAEPVSSVS
jgi:hypothetical protein